MNFIKLIEAIREKPYLFLQEKSIHLLSAMLDGYDFACGLNNLQEEKPRDLLINFGYFVCNYYKIQTSTKNWSDIILENNQQDEEKSFHDFFYLFERFIENNYILKNKI